jgi:uncharacterized surface protein with fasciclin (FAS1) repeats
MTSTHFIAFSALVLLPAVLYAQETQGYAPSREASADIIEMTISEAETVAEKPLPIIKADGKLMVGNATVTKADIPASNGIIHVIDTVLLPE